MTVDQMLQALETGEFTPIELLQLIEAAAALAMARLETAK